jgi:hypothetical protein
VILCANENLSGAVEHIDDPDWTRLRSADEKKSLLPFTRKEDLSLVYENLAAYFLAAS